MPQEKCILLVEDNPDDVFFLKRAVHKANANIELVVVNSGDEALSFLSSNYRRGEGSKVKLSLVLLDLNLPKLNGLVLLQVLNSHGWLRTLPVVVVSTSTEEVHEIESMDAGAWEFIQKPLTTEKVAELLKKYLFQEKAHEAKEEAGAVGDESQVAFAPTMRTSAGGQASVPEIIPQLLEDADN